MASPPLALLLLQASRWFDERLLDRLADRGWPRLSPAQSLVFAHLDDGGTRLAELARRLGTSRQAVSDLMTGMTQLGVLQIIDDPDRRRSRLVVLTDTGAALAADAGHLLGDLEAEFGATLSANLRDLLMVSPVAPNRPWASEQHT